MFRFRALCCFQSLRYKSNFSFLCRPMFTLFIFFALVCPGLRVGISYTSRPLPRCKECHHHRPFWKLHWTDFKIFNDNLEITFFIISRTTVHQWLRQISMKLPFAVLRKSALKFTIGGKRENSISYYFPLFWFHQNSISVLKTLLSCLSEKTL